MTTTGTKLDDYFTALTTQKQFNGNVLVASQGRDLLRKTYNILGQSDSLRVAPTAGSLLPRYQSCLSNTAYWY